MAEKRKVSKFSEGSEGSSEMPAFSDEKMSEKIAEKKSLEVAEKKSRRGKKRDAASIGAASESAAEFSAEEIESKTDGGSAPCDGAKDEEPAKEKSVEQQELEAKENPEAEASGEEDKLASVGGEDSQTKEGGEENQTQEPSEDVIEQDIGLSKEAVDEKLKISMESQSPKKKKKSTIINLILLAVNIVFMVFIIKNLVGSIGSESGDLLTVLKSRGSRLWWLGGGVLVYVFYIIIQMLMYYYLIKELTGKKRPWLAYDVGLLGKYYDNITPFAVGGQPMQIVRLATSGISAGTSTSIPIIKMIINNFINMLIALAFFIFGLPHIPSADGFNDILLVLLEILGVIGLVITVILVVIMFLISSGRLITRSFISGVMRIGYKLKIVKNYRKSFKKALNQVAEYNASMSYLRKHKLLLLKMLILSVLESLSYAIIPYFVIMAFIEPAELAAFTPLAFVLICLTKYYVCSMASSFIPLPGGTGMMEISFIFLFGLSLGNDNIVWALLLWRIISYYLLIAHGFLHELIRIFRRMKTGKKEVKVPENPPEQELLSK